MPKPIVIEKRYAAPIHRVFALFADIPSAAEHVEGITKIEMLTKGPVGQGTRWRETRLMFKKEATEELEITEFAPNSHYEVSCESCGMEFRTMIRFETDGAGTRVEQTTLCTPRSFLAQVLSPLASMMSKSMKKLMSQDLDDLEKVLQG